MTTCVCWCVGVVVVGVGWCGVWCGVAWSGPGVVCCGNGVVWVCLVGVGVGVGGRLA